MLLRRDLRAGWPLTLGIPLPHPPKYWHHSFTSLGSGGVIVQCVLKTQFKRTPKSIFLSLKQDCVTMPAAFVTFSNRSSLKESRFWLFRSLSQKANRLSLIVPLPEDPQLISVLLMRLDFKAGVVKCNQSSFIKLQIVLR